MNLLTTIAHIQISWWVFWQWFSKGKMKINWRVMKYISPILACWYSMSADNVLGWWCPWHRFSAMYLFLGHQPRTIQADKYQPPEGVYYQIVDLECTWSVLIIWVKGIPRRTVGSDWCFNTSAEVISRVKWRLEIHMNVVMLWSGSWVVRRVMWLVMRMVCGDWCISIWFVSEGHSRL